MKKVLIAGAIAATFTLTGCQSNAAKEPYTQAPEPEKRSAVAAIATASSRASVEFLESLPERHKAHAKVYKVFAEKSAEFRERHADAFQAHLDRYGIDPFGSSEFGREEQRSA